METTTSCTERYQYTPLEKKEIRLLKILPGPENTIVSCHIEHFSLDDIPEYAALSYTWGTDAAQYPIRVNDQILQINSNLNDALLRFRAKPVRFEDHALVDRFHRIAYRIPGLLKDVDQSDIEKDEQFASTVKVMQEYLAQGDQLADTLRAAYAEGARHLRDHGQTDEPEVNLQRILKSIEDLWTVTTPTYNLPTLDHEYELMWVDAICINQEDLDERAEQVKLMREIYKRSHCLAVWLGCQKDNSELGFSAINRLEEASYPGAVDRRPGCSFNTTEEDFEAISSIFQRPYFTRAWVLQEYVLGCLSHQASKVNRSIFYCGFEQSQNLMRLGSFIICGIRHGMGGKERGASRDRLRELLQPFGSLRLGCQVITQLRHHGEFNPLDTEKKKIPTTNISKPRHCGEPNPPYKEIQPPPTTKMTLDLLALLWLCFGSKSTDPRDKIYSLLGLAEELSPAGRHNGYSPKHLIIDYNASVLDVYSSSVYSIVTEKKRLDILGYCQKGPETAITRTWTPDWSGKLVRPLHEDMTGTMVESWGSGDNLLFDATSNSTSNFKFSSDLTTLTVRGFILGKVSFICSPKGPTTYPPETEGQFIAGNCHTVFARMQEFFHNTGTIELFNILAAILVPTTTHRYPANSAILQLAAIRDWWSPMLKAWLLRDDDTKSSEVYDLDTVLSDPGGKINDNDLSKALRQAFTSGENSTPIILTSSGHIGKTRPAVKEGDLICLILGCIRPMVLREIDGHFILIADAWIEGAMHGEMMEKLDHGEFKLEDFELH